VFTLTRFGSREGAASVEFRTAPSSATTPADFTTVIQTVNFAPGDDVETVAVAVAPDTLQEANEVFSASLAAPQNTTAITGFQQAIIIDDDESLLYITSRATEEGDPGSPRTLTFTVQRLGSLAGTTSVNFTATPSSATTPADFLAAAGTLVFAPGVAAQTFDVQVVGDLTRETLEEALNATLSAVQNGTIVVTSSPGTILDDDPAPVVTAVYVSGSGWRGSEPSAVTFKEYLEAQNLGSTEYGYRIPAGAEQALALPWINLNRVSITFSQPVRVDREDLSVRGTNRAAYAFAAGDAGFEYDADMRTATWTFDAPLTKDRVLLDLDASAATGVASQGGELLDGEWANFLDAWPSGNGIGGGDFLFRLNVLPGDASRNGSVLANDFSDVKKKFFRATTNVGTGDGAYTVFHDVDGSGSILANDFSEVKKRFFDVLPGASPTAAGTFGERRIGSITDEVL
jgi:hypothetical protein